MCIKATIVAYAFSVQYFESVTIVAYAGLRVKWLLYFINLQFDFTLSYPDICLFSLVNYIVF